MINPAFTSALLFALSVPVIMRYSIFPIEGTPYWLFGLLLFLFVINCFFSLYFQKTICRKYSDFASSVIFFFLIFVVVIGPMWTAIVDRAKTAPVYNVHDIILQEESAMRYLLEGKNPYKETYFGTPLEEFNYDEVGNTDAVNPALYHFVMPPWYLVFPFAFYFISVPVFGFFDARMALIFCTLGILFIIYKWFKDKKAAQLAMLLTVLSPAVVDYLIEGRSDMFALFWFVWALYFLEKKNVFWSCIIFGLALMSKQTIWVAFPFFLIYAYITNKKSLHVVIKVLYLCGIVVLALCLPYLYWDSKAFFDSVVFYLSGSTEYGYPVSGYGLGMILYNLGIIKDIHSYYPFIYWQMLFGLPVFALAIWWLVKKPLVSRFLVGYATVLFVVWYTSRYFNNSHVSFLSMIYVLGVLKDWDEANTK